MVHHILFGIILISGLLTGCAAQTGLSEIKNDTVQLKAQMSAMQMMFSTSADMDSLSAYIASLENLVREQTNLLWSMRADINSRVSNLDNRVQVIDAKISESGRQFSNLSQKMEGVKAQLSTTALPDTAASGLLDPEELYNTALADYQRGNYELAIQQFLQYLQYFPDTELADNAQYWIGDCYYTQQKFLQAMDAYNKVINGYPKGNKVPAALFKIGLAQLGLEDMPAGRAALERVINEYPKSEEAKLARLRLETLSSN